MAGDSTPKDLETRTIFIFQSKKGRIEREYNGLLHLSEGAIVEVLDEKRDNGAVQGIPPGRYQIFPESPEHQLHLREEGHDSLVRYYELRRIELRR